MCFSLPAIGGKDSFVINYSYSLFFSSIREFMKFSGKMLAEKTESGRHLSVREEGYEKFKFSNKFDLILPLFHFNFEFLAWEIFQNFAP